MIEKYFQDDLTPIPFFKLLNSQNGEFHEVGLVTSTSTTIDKTIHFLGNTTIPPVITGAAISFTLNNVVEANG